MVAPTAVASEDEKVFDLRFTISEGTNIKSSRELVSLLLKLIDEWDAFADVSIEDLTRGRLDHRLGIEG